MIEKKNACISIADYKSLAEIEQMNKFWLSSGSFNKWLVWQTRLSTGKLAIRAKNNSVMSWGIWLMGDINLLKNVNQHRVVLK